MSVLVLAVISVIFCFGNSENDMCACDQSEMKCIPSISALGKTVNLFTGETTKFGLSAIEWTCKNFSYYDPVTKETWQIYGEMNVDAVPYGHVSTQRYETGESLSKVMKESVHADGKYSYFEGSADVTRIDSNLVENNEFFVLTEQMMKIFDYALTMPLEYQTPSADFTKMVDTYLPSNYDETKYFDSIENVLGTHVIVETVVGGVGSMKTDVKYNYYESQSQTDLQADAKVYFVNLQTGMGFNKTTKAWQNYSATTAVVRGGDPQYTNFREWDNWLGTIRSQPVRITYTVEPVHDLIKDEGKKANYKQAVEQYSKRMIPTEVPNCTHWEIADKSPPHTLENIGPMGDKQLFLVEGPDEQDRCLVSLMYKDDGKQPRLVMKDVARSKTVDVDGWMFFKYGTAEINLDSSAGSCYGTESIEKAPVSCHSQTQSEPYSIPWLKDLKCVQHGVIWPYTYIVCWGAILQPRVIVSVV